jgi:aryl-alcohol dehydrogenase
LDLDEPRPDEILVRLIACGVSETDLAAIDGTIPMPLPFVPGREGAGIVERVGTDVASVEPGDAVVVTFDHCGICSACFADKPMACSQFAELNLSGRRNPHSALARHDGTAIHGSFFGQSAFATHLLCKARSAIRLPSDAPIELMAPFGGDLLSAAGTILHDFAIAPGDSILIHGAGFVGLVATMLAKARGAALIIVAEDDERCRGVASDLGADVAVHGSSDLETMVRSLSADGVRYAFETRGSPDAYEACLACLAPNGRCVTSWPAARAINQEPDASAGGADRLADLNAPAATLIAALITLREKGKFPIERLIDFFAFAHVEDAFDALRHGACVKPVLRFPLGGFASNDRANVEGAAEEMPQPPDAPSTADDSRLSEESGVKVDQSARGTDKS